MEYIVANPTGNITVLVTDTGYDVSDISELAPEVKAAIVRDCFDLVPECEQVGFIAFPAKSSDGASQAYDISLEMMGGEFCGNATISTAAYLCMINETCVGSSSEVSVNSSGVSAPVSVTVKRLGAKEFTGTLEMPVPEVSEYDGYPLINLDGISHILMPVGAEHPELDLADDVSIGAYLKTAADKLELLAVGLILYATAESDSSVSITPIVYVPGSNTLFHEQGCASGSTAVGYYQHYINPALTDITIRQPGGSMIIHIGQDNLALTGSIIFK